jgi:hypothetical protein
MPAVVERRAETRAVNRLDELETVCAELYQVLGTLGAPVRVLDQVLAAAEGRTLPSPTLLPFSVREAMPAAAATVLGARGGSATSVAKRKASAENGQLGGRPRVPQFTRKVAARKK